jgi:thiol-disulfide isomerase/thioredoxin
MSQRPTPNAATAVQRGLSRRTALIVAGVAAAAAGAGWRLSRTEGPEVASGPGTVPTPDAILASTTASTTASAPTDALPADFWQLAFDRPEGGQIALASLRGKPVLINFWATWCPPCVKEMPELDRFQREFAAKGWTVLGLAIDGPTPVREFLAKVRVGFTLGLAGLDGTELSQKLGNASGSLPFSVMLDVQGRIAQRKLGATHFDELAAWARAITP